MSKKLIYITVYNFNRENGSGVIKKIRQQIKAFSQKGFQVDYFFTRKKESGLYLVSENQELLVGNVKGVKGIGYWKLIAKYLKEHQYDCAYVRHTGRIDPWVLKVLKILYRSNTRTVYEFPTYPYEKISKSFMGKLDLLIDKIFRNCLKKYVNAVITFSKDKYIYGIPTINIQNGITVKDIRPIKKLEQSSEIMNLIAVASLREYYGYDKIISSLGKYYQAGGDRKIIIHLIGEGEVSKEYNELIRLYNLEKNVILYGSKYGEELDEIYDNADIALGAFRLYMIELYEPSLLKTREYLAKGLPIISGCKEDIFQGRKCDYYLEFSNDDEPIEMESIIQFYDKLYQSGSRQKLQKEIREFAKESVDWMVVLKPIFDFFEE